MWVILQKGALIQGLIKEHSPKLIVEVTPSCCPFLLYYKGIYIYIYAQEIHVDTEFSFLNLGCNLFELRSFNLVGKSWNSRELLLLT